MSFAGDPPPDPHGHPPPNPAPADDAGPDPTSPPAGWLDLTQARTRGLGCALVVVLALLLAAVVMASEATGGEEIRGGLAAGAVGLALVAVVLSASIGYAAPRLLTRQGVAVDAGGVTLLQEPRWWFGGKRIHLPWAEVVSITAELTSFGENSSSDSENSESRPHALRAPRGRTIVICVRHEPPASQVPGFASIVQAHAQGLGHMTPRGVPSLLVTTFDHHAFLTPVAAIRPDLLVEPGADHPQPPPVPETSTGTRTETPTDTPTESGGWMSTRGFQIVGWLLGLGVLGGVAFAVRPEDVLLDVAALLAGESGDLTTGQVVYPLLWSLGVLALLSTFLVTLPANWTVQGVDVTPHGISMVRRPMWWFAGRTGFIPWRDISHVTWEVNRGDTKVLEIHLRWVDHTMWLPHWAKLALAGEEKRGRTTDHPRVTVALVQADLRRLEWMISQVRPDLRRAPDDMARSGVAADTGPVPPPPGATRPHWISLRIRRMITWVLALLVALYLGGVAVYSLAVALTEFDPADTVTAEELLGLLTTPVVATVLTVWVVAMAPRMLTHQGVSVDESGITLVQEPTLWFPGRTVHLPWSEVRLARPEVIRHRRRNSRTERVVDIYLHQPDRIADVPTWARVTPHEDERPPASVTRPMTRITVKPGKSVQPYLVAALRAVRPDLVDTAAL